MMSEIGRVYWRSGYGLLVALVAACGGTDDDGGGDGGNLDTAAIVPPLASSGCDGSALQPGQEVVEIEHDGMTRSYTLYVPEGLEAGTPAPLVFNYHGLTSNAAQQVTFSNMNGLADSKGFVLVYPEGLSSSFNAGSCCSELANPPHTADDVGFTRAILDDMGSRGCIDMKRVYSTGMSNGGYMSEYNACENADIFAAVAPVSAMAFKQTDCEPSRPIPMIAFNGTSDGLVNYDSALVSVDEWLVRNGCDGEPERVDYGESYCRTWHDCADGVEMVHCTLTGMGHCWPGQTFCPFGAANTDVDANAEIWDFLSRHTLP